MIVEGFSCRLHGEDSSEFAFVYPKGLLEGTPSSTEEDGIEYLRKARKRLRIVKTLWRWGTSLNYFTVDVFCELYSALSSA